MAASATLGAATPIRESYLTADCVTAVIEAATFVFELASRVFALAQASVALIDDEPIRELYLTALVASAPTDCAVSLAALDTLLNPFVATCSCLAALSVRVA